MTEYRLSGRTNKPPGYSTSRNRPGSSVVSTYNSLESFPLRSILRYAMFRALGAVK